MTRMVLIVLMWYTSKQDPKKVSLGGYWSSMNNEWLSVLLTVTITVLTPKRFPTRLRILLGLTRMMMRLSYWKVGWQYQFSCNPRHVLHEDEKEHHEEEDSEYVTWEDLAGLARGLMDASHAFQEMEHQMEVLQERIWQLEEDVNDNSHPPQRSRHQAHGTHEMAVAIIPPWKITSKNGFGGHLVVMTLSLDCEKKVRSRNM